MFGAKKKGDGGSKQSEKDDGEQKAGGGGGGFGKFWHQVVLRKKPKEEAETPMTADEKNLLAAEVATGTLEGLDSRAQEQVKKAIAAEMRRRHEERERRRSELMKSTAVQLPWGPKVAGPTPEEAAAAPAPTSARKMSAGASMYPIRMELKQPKDGKGKFVPSHDTWDDSGWRPVAVVGPIGPTLEQQRKAWIEKTLKHGMGTTGKADKKTTTQPAAAKKEVSASESSSSASSSFGAQPAAIQMDEDAVKEIHAHTLGQMLRNIIIEASNKQQQVHHVKGKSKSIKPPASKKKPEDMTPDELIAFRKREPKAWDDFTRQNTIISFGVTTPTDEDTEKGKKGKAKNRERELTFEDEIEVAQAPVGKDYYFNEKLTRGKGVLKK